MIPRPRLDEPVSRPPDGFRRHGLAGHRSRATASPRLYSRAAPIQVHADSMSQLARQQLSKSEGQLSAIIKKSFVARSRIERGRRGGQPIQGVEARVSEQRVPGGITRGTCRRLTTTIVQPCSCQNDQIGRGGNGGEDGTDVIAFTAMRQRGGCMASLPAHTCWSESSETRHCATPRMSEPVERPAPS